MKVLFKDGYALVKDGNTILLKIDEVEENYGVHFSINNTESIVIEEDDYQEDYVVKLYENYEFIKELNIKYS